MSLDLARQIDAQYPALLQTNIASTCSQFADYLVAALRAQGHEAYRMCKSPGEGQYTPPGFVPRDVIGIDGKTYRCSGISHDAIWCNGKQYDTIGQGNDSDHPIFHPDGSPMRGVPTWNAIPPQFWRPNNPPLKEGAVTPGPVPPPHVCPTLKVPSYAELGDDAFFRAMIGVPLQADYTMAGQQLNDGAAVWFSRATYRLMAAFIAAQGQPINPSAEVRIVRNEWRQILGLPPV